ncbi:MAG: hypothetical protein FJ303_02650 [Planctomycetes bacterium]|nr:hypothetical protein [Planctomycetota bacterium]
MSTSPSPTEPSAAKEPEKREIRVISHCSLFYWWPVWLTALIMFLISWFSGHRLAIVPEGTHTLEKLIWIDPTHKDKEAAEKVGIHPNDKEKAKRRVLVLPYFKDEKEDKAQMQNYEDPRLHMTTNKNLGVLFVAILLLVIGITNIPLRGLWSVIVIVILLSLSIIFAVLEWWAIILTWLSFLDIRINAAGYLAIFLVLFTLWVFVFFLFDRQMYISFTPGQMRVRKEIGEAETVYGTEGMSVQKQPSDLFRHWILGLGSGDIIVRTGGSNAQEIHLPNVLFVGWKIAQIEELLAQKQVVPGKE